MGVWAGAGSGRRETTEDSGSGCAACVPSCVATVGSRHGGSGQVAQGPRRAGSLRPANDSNGSHYSQQSKHGISCSLGFGSFIHSCFFQLLSAW